MPEHVKKDVECKVEVRGGGYKRHQHNPLTLTSAVEALYNSNKDVKGHVQVGLPVLFQLC